MTKLLVTEGHLNDIAEAIRLKTGSGETYRPGDMAAAIRGLTPQMNLQAKAVTQNGLVEPDAGYDGLSRVEVNVAAGDALPPGYTRLAYARGNGAGAYVDTGLVPAADTWIEETLLPVFTNTEGNWEFGCRVAYQDTMFALMGRSPEHNNWFNIDLGEERHATEVGEDGANVYHIVFNRDGFHINGEDLNIAAPAAAPSLPIFMLSINNNGAPMANYYSKSAVLDFRVGDGSGERMRLVPCRRASDSAVGFYDVIGGAFYGNAGSGGLIAGPEI